MTMSTLAKPWEKASESSADSPVASGAGTVVPHNGAGDVAVSSSLGSPQAMSTTSVKESIDGVQHMTSTSGRVNQSNLYTPSYGSGLGYGGLGMGGMYGSPFGMGGMYGSPFGMGGMYGSPLGMGGMYGSPLGMSEDFQRSQMTFMLVGRLLEMCSMFAGVIQITFGSALQFMSSYIGMSQQYNQLKSGMYMDDQGKWVQIPKKINGGRSSSRHSHHQKSIKGRSQRGRIWITLLRRLIFFLLAILVVKKFTKFAVVRQHPLI